MSRAVEHTDQGEGTTAGLAVPTGVLLVIDDEAGRRRRPRLVRGLDPIERGHPITSLPATLAGGAPVTGETRGAGKNQQHPRIAEGVGLDVLQVEEFGHAGVIGAAQRVVGVVVDRRALDLDEPGPAEEAGVEGQREQPGEPQFTRRGDQRLEDRPSDAVLNVVGVHGEGADLAEIGPEHVQGPAPHDPAVHLGDLEVLDVLVQGDQFLGQYLASGACVDVDDRLDRRDIGRAGATDEGLHAGNLSAAPDQGIASSAFAYGARPSPLVHWIPRATRSNADCRSAFACSCARLSPTVDPSSPSLLTPKIAIPSWYRTPMPSSPTHP